MNRSVLVTTLVLLASACGEVGSTVSAVGYDQSCAVAADCVIVAAGDACKCLCDVAAINIKDRDGYDADLEAKAAACPSDAHPCPCGHPSMTVACQAGTCTIKPGP